MGVSGNNEMKTEIKEYINRADDRMLKLIYAIIEADQDWWDEISTEEKHSIETGARQLKEGKGISHEDVIKNNSKWFTR
jgi:hypothetical protein